MLKSRHEHKVMEYMDLSANDALRAQQVLVMITIVIGVDLQRVYKSPTTSLP